MKTISFINLKGGVGKSTIALAFADRLTRLGKRVLIVDLDQQMNATQQAGAKTEEVATVYDLLTTGDFKARDAAQPSPYGDIVPGDLLVSEADPVISQLDTSLTMLADALEGAGYDYVVIDCPPSLSLVSRNALVASDEVICVLDDDEAAVTGVAKVHNMVMRIRSNRRLNPDLRIAGFVVNRFVASKKLARKLDADLPKLAEACGTEVFDTKVRQDEKIRQAKTEYASIFDYAPASKGACDLAALVDEYLEKEVG